MAYTKERLDWAMELFLEKSSQQKFDKFTGPKCYSLRKRDPTASKLSSTWIDQDDTSDYDPNEKRVIIKRKRRIIDVSGPSRPTKRVAKGPTRALLTLSLTSDAGRAFLETLPKGQQGTRYEIDEELEQWKTGVWEVPKILDGELGTKYALRKRERHSYDDSGPFAGISTARSILSLDLGDPAARGCRSCWKFNHDCSLLDRPLVYPCQVCKEDRVDCVLITPPLWKRPCENCKTRKKPCSYSYADTDHSLPCNRCQVLGICCLAGPAKYKPEAGKPDPATEVDDGIGPARLTSRDRPNSMKLFIRYQHQVRAAVNTSDLGLAATKRAQLTVTTASTKRRKVAEPSRPDSLPGLSFASSPNNRRHGSQSGDSLPLPLDPGRPSPASDSSRSRSSSGSPSRYVPAHLKGDALDFKARSPSPDSSHSVSGYPSAACAGLSLSSDNVVDMTGLEKKDGSLPPPPDHEARSSSPGTKRTAAEITGTDQHAKSGTNADDGLPSDPMSTDSAAMTGSTNFNKAGYSEQLGSENTYSTPPSMGTGDQSKAESATESDVRPSIDDQVAKVNCAAAQPLKENQKGYVVSMSWMKRVFARSSNYTDKADTSSTEGEIGPVDNTDLALATEQPVKDETGEPFVPLRKGLQMGTDYEIVPQEGWDMIMHWYGLADGSPVIVRYTHNTAPADAVENIQYEINPPIFAIFKLSNPANGTTPQTLKDKNTPTPRTVASRTTPFQKWLRHAKSLANIDMSTKVRIWKLGTAPEGSGAAVTPVMSRGAVPTPATTNAGSFGNCLTMDLNTFLSLSDGQRQLQEGFKDQTHNANYNGRSTLDMAGFGEGEIMVVLEESLGGKGVQWVSEASQKELNFYGVSTGNKSPGNNSPGKTKTAPLPKPKAKTPPVTRNRSPVASPAKRWGSKPLGCTGLSNSGNTCYFASALQCLQNVKELTCYFLSSKHKSELNPSNPIGCRGEIASAYGHLIRSLYEGNSHVKLDHIKKKAGKYVPAFSGNGQQDSQECVLFLLDGLHEDVNRVLKKPYREKPDSTDEMIHDPEALRKFAQEHWDIYKARNDSVITDLFAAMYKSSIECPVCHKVSLHFEPYTSLTVPIPSNEVWSHVFFYFPLHGSPVRINIEVPTHFTLGNVREQAAKLMRCDPNRVVLAEITGSRFFKVFDESKAVGSKANDSSDIRDADQLAFFEVDDVPTDYSPKRPKKSFRQFEIANKTPDFYSSAADRMLIPVFNRAWLRRSPFIQKKERKLFGAPSFIVVSREEAHDYDRILRKLLRVADNMTTYDLFNDEVISEESAIDGDDADSADSKIKASSVEGEDGMVNISVREETDRNQDSGTILHSEKPIPPRYRNLFDVRTMRAERTVPLISSTFEGKNHPLMSSRIPSKPSDPENWSKGEDEDSSTSERKASDESDGYASANSSSDSDCDISPPNRRRSMQSDRSPLILPGEGIVLDWTEDAYDKLFGNDTSEEESFRGSLIWGNFDLELIESEEVKRARSRREERRRKVMTVYDCFDEFMKAEVLSSGNAWWCDSCKDFRQAIKKVGLWTAPDIIPIHLKRFSNGTWRTSKIRNYIDFPVKGLDLTRYVEAPEEGKSYIYDLFAVDNHSGSIGGGHYTAHAKNFNDDNWYNFNDSTVSGPVDAEDAKSDLAYLLFYRRRSDRPLGGKALEEITESTMRALNEGELSSDSEVSVSASGEARRLGGSSLNGSSSALVKAGAAHRAGDGGNAVENEYAEQYEPPFSNFDSSEDFFGNSNSTGQEGMNFDNDYDIGTGSVSDAFNYNDSMWSFDRASNAHLSSQMTAAPPASLYDGDHGNYPDDAASDRAVDGDETSEPEVRLASLTDGAGDFDAAYGPPTPMDITQDIPAPREDDDSDELDVVELRVNDEDDKSHSN